MTEDGAADAAAPAGEGEQERLDAIAAAGRQRVLDANELARNRSMVAEGRRKAGMAGAMMAGAMIALRDIYEGPKKDEGSVVVDSPTDPLDLDEDGVTFGSDEVGGAHDIAVPAQPRRAPITPAAARRRASRRRR